MPSNESKAFLDSNLQKSCRNALRFVLFGRSCRRCLCDDYICVFNTKRVKLQKYLRSISTYQVHKILDAAKYSDIWYKHFLNRLFQFWKMAFDKKETLDWQFPEAKCGSLLVMIIFWCPKGTRDLRGVFLIQLLRHW